MHTLVTHNAILFFDTSSDKQLNIDTRSKTNQPENTDNRDYCCINCKTFVVKLKNATQIEGRHKHQKTNPQGQQFNILCFDMAPGCSPDGPLTLEATWFSNFQWRITCCKSCKIQLGWQFMGATGFYGLIAERMVHCGN
jgi:hypothetical protein